MTTWSSGIERAAHARTHLPLLAAVTAWGLGVFGLSGAVSAQGGALHTYGQTWRAIAMPPTGAGSSQLAGDVLPDGRIVAVTGMSVFVESGVGTGTFDVVALLDPGAIGGNGAVDPGFVRVSPDGARLAIGGGFGKPVVVAPLAALGTPGAPTLLGPGQASFYPVANYDGAWAGPTQLGLTSGVFGAPAQVTVLDVTSPVQAPTNTPVIVNIGGASAGIAFDAAGRLYTGNGFDLGPGGSGTGTIRAFDPALWMSGAPADFEASGTLIGTMLSASSLGFDLEGNLLVGGADFAAGETGYLGVAGAAALAAALAGLGPVDIENPAEFLRLTPPGSTQLYFGSAFNPVTGELYLTATDFFTGTTTWYATVPGPGAAVLLCLAPLARRRGVGR
ncbi:MAG TPA: hypothetical protein VD963_00045 [Phycisphaerales bacterium]|nr:hypothetical protein [Phycisphaerales bacterium]